MTELPPEICHVLKRMFADEDLEETTRLLETIVETYPQLRDQRRVLHDVVFGANGDLAKFRKLAELAQKDWRDLIMAVEYELVDGKIVKRTGFLVYEP